MLIGLAWFVAIAFIYHLSGIDRFWYFARRRWAVMVAVIVLASSIPFAAASAVLVAKTPAAWRPRTQALCSALAGILSIPLTNLVSALAAQLASPYLTPDQ